MRTLYSGSAVTCSSPGNYIASQGKGMVNIAFHKPQERSNHSGIGGIVSTPEELPKNFGKR